MSQRAARSGRWRAWSLGLLLAAGVAHATPAARAAEIAVSASAPVPAPQALPVQVKDNAILLTLDEAVEIGLRQNLDVVLQRDVRNESRLSIEQNLGIYDLTLTGQASAASQKSAPTSALTASQSNRQVFNVGLTQLVPTGGQLTFGFNNNRENSNLSFSSFNPSYNSGLSLAYNQPLLQSFGRLATERGILLARSRSRSSVQDFAHLVVATVQSVVNAYWSLVGARQQLVVAQESLALAKELHERNRVQVEVGTMAPLELIQSEAAIASREGDIISAQGAVGDAEDTLRRLLNLQQGPLWQAEIRPVTDPVTDRVAINLDAAIRNALATRPELKVQEEQVVQAQINDEYFKNQLKPRLDLNLSYGTAGAGGNLILRDANGNVVGFLPGGFSDAFSQATGFQFYGWQVQLNFSYPLQNRAARATSAIADLDLARMKITLDSLHQTVITEVRQAARRVDTAAKQIDAAKASRQFQEKNLDAERKRYENGMSTSFEITRIQQDVTTARSLEVNAIISYRTALADFYRATGRLLDISGIRLEDPAENIDRWRFHLFH